jgi:hypothetical protein
VETVWGMVEVHVSEFESDCCWLYQLIVFIGNIIIISILFFLFFTNNCLWLHHDNKGTYCEVQRSFKTMRWQTFWHQEIYLAGMYRSDLLSVTLKICSAVEWRLVFHVGETGVSCLQRSGDILLHVGVCWNCLPAIWGLKGATRWKSLSPILSARLWLVMALELGGYALSSLQLDLTPGNFHHYELPMHRGANMKQAGCRFFTPVSSVEILALVLWWCRHFNVNWALMCTIC